jgi:hypothetical protein
MALEMALEIGPMDSHTLRKHTAATTSFRRDRACRVSACRHVAISHHYDFLKTPNMIRNASSHSRGRAKCTMNFDEVAVKRTCAENRGGTAN